MKTPENPWLENYIYQRAVRFRDKVFGDVFAGKTRAICLGKKMAQISVNWTLVIVDDSYGWCFPLVCRR